MSCFPSSWECVCLFCVLSRPITLIHLSLSPRKVASSSSSHTKHWTLDMFRHPDFLTTRIILHPWLKTLFQSVARVNVHALVPPVTFDSRTHEVKRSRFCFSGDVIPYICRGGPADDLPSSLSCTFSLFPSVGHLFTCSALRLSRVAHRIVFLPPSPEV